MDSTDKSPLGIFMSGCVVGMILSWSGFGIFFAGVLTGIVIQSSGPDVGNSVLRWCVYASSILFQHLRVYMRNDDTIDEKKMD